MVETWKESDLMNCLKCPIFWQTEVDEAECDKCGGDKTIADFSPTMPPLIIPSEVTNNG